MELPDTIYLVRHGRYRDMHLTEEGRTVDAVRARDSLLARLVGRGVVLLSSNAPRALETAVIIGQGLGVEPVPSALINNAGNSWGVADLDAVVEEAMSVAGVELGVSQDLVVVSHAPMLAIAKGTDDPMKVGYGEVFPYPTGSWNNPIAPRSA